MSKDFGSRVSINSPVTEGVIGNLATLGGDVATLAELQVQLAVEDVKESIGHAVWPVAMIATGLVLLLAAMPVALIGGSELLADAMSLTHRGWAYLIVAGVVLAITIVLVLVALPIFTRSFASLVRSKEELARNVAWIKTVLANSGRPPVHRRNGTAK